jgi:hypothetical protein
MLAWQDVEHSVGPALPASRMIRLLLKDTTDHTRHSQAQRLLVRGQQDDRAMTGSHFRGDLRETICIGQIQDSVRLKGVPVASRNDRLRRCPC